MQHFTKFSTWYVSGHYFVDIHPPLAKLAFAAVLWAVGFSGAHETDVKWWTDKGFVGTIDWKLLYDPAYGEAFMPLRTLRLTMARLTSQAIAITAPKRGAASPMGRALAKVQRLLRWKLRQRAAAYPSMFAISALA